MKNAINRANVLAHWLLALVAVLLLVTELGMTDARVVEPLTFGLLTKNLASQIHIFLWVPFAILLLLHIVLSAMTGPSGKSRGKK